jgi:hypothetical protein
MSDLRGVEQVQRNLEKWQRDVEKRVKRVADEIAVLLEGYAKTHHAWQPQTGATDVSTKGSVQAA